jgi:hypothetical protein
VSTALAIVPKAPAARVGIAKVRLQPLEPQWMRCHECRALFELTIAGQAEPRGPRPDGVVNFCPFCGREAA